MKFQFWLAGVALAALGGFLLIPAAQFGALVVVDMNGYVSGVWTHPVEWGRDYWFNLSFTTRGEFLGAVYPSYFFLPFLAEFGSVTVLALPRIFDLLGLVLFAGAAAWCLRRAQRYLALS